MAYDIQQLIDDCQHEIGVLGIRLPKNSDFKHNLEIIRECNSDRASDPLGFKESWADRRDEWHAALTSVVKVSRIVRVLRGTPNLKPSLEVVVQGNTVQDFSQSHAKDILYELDLASQLKESLFDVQLREPPDLLIRGNCLSGPLAIACKYPSSRNQLHTRFTEGRHQIARQGFDGLVVIGMDLIIGIELIRDFMDENGRAAVPVFDLDAAPCNPFEFFLARIGREVRRLEAERPLDYPSEMPINELLMTFSLVGFCGDPPTVTNIMSATLYAHTQEHPRCADFRIIERAFNGVGAGLPPGNRWSTAAVRD
jgi:hypothetical protein